MKIGLCLAVFVVLTHSQEESQNCSNRSPLCNFWGYIGECGVNPDYMIPNCKGACDPLCILSEQDFDATSCEDQNDNCETWATNGECAANPYYMLWKCKRSCYPPCIALDIDPADIDCEHDENWKAYKEEWGLSYEEIQEEQEIYKFYCQNRDFIDEWNKGDKDFELGFNSYSHLNPEQFAQVNGHKPRNLTADVQHFDEDAATGEIPDSIDWREKGAVAPVVDQGMCGSCFAFSAVGAMEGQNQIKTDDLVALSQQQVLDCSADKVTGDKYGNLGCGGGNAAPSFQYVQDAGGIDSAESYPYEDKDKEKNAATAMTNRFPLQTGECRFDEANIAAKVTGYVQVTHPDTTMDAEKLKKAVATVGPISAVVYTGGGGLNTGIFKDPGCEQNKDPSNTDHAVLIVGYGTTDDGTDYWIVKNSYGTDWGEDGFFRIERGVNSCFIESDTSYPLM